jgi:hypothetical protein
MRPLASSARHSRLVELAFVDVDPARFRAAHRTTGWDWSQPRALEEGHSDVMGEDME